MMNPIVQHMAVDAERHLVSGQAERGWRAAEAAALQRQSRPHLTTRAQWFAGRLLVRVGTRLQGLPRLEPLVPPVPTTPSA